MYSQTWGHLGAGARKPRQKKVKPLQRFEFNLEPALITDELREKVKNNWGFQYFPCDGRAVYGARWIFPGDVVWDRCSWAIVEGQEDKERDKQQDKLKNWLLPAKDKKPWVEAQKRARELKDSRQINSASNFNVVLFEDARGIIVGSPQGSHGYFYVAAWLKKKP